jgi:hypothetical protein
VPFEEIPSSLSSSSSSSVSLLAADFWTREAFGLEAPAGGFGVDEPELPPPDASAGAPAKRRRRRRGRRVAPRAEAAAPV